MHRLRDPAGQPEGMREAYPVVFSFHRDLPIVATLNSPLGVFLL